MGWLYIAEYNHNNGCMASYPIKYMVLPIRKGASSINSVVSWYSALPVCRFTSPEGPGVGSVKDFRAQFSVDNGSKSLRSANTRYPVGSTWARC